MYRALVDTLISRNNYLESSYCTLSSSTHASPATDDLEIKLCYSRNHLSWFRCFYDFVNYFHNGRRPSAASFQRLWKNSVLSICILPYGCPKWAHWMSVVRLMSDYYYPFPVICGFLIDNTGSLVLTTQKLQKLAGGIYFCCAYWKMQKVLGYLENWVQRMLSGCEFSLFAENVTLSSKRSHRHVKVGITACFLRQSVDLIIKHSIRIIICLLSINNLKF